MNRSDNHFPVVCFGEILWDILPAGPLPGGAPMNVAFHLKRLGVEPALVTRIGTDDPGRRLIRLMDEQAISTRFFQFDPALATGQVNVVAGENQEIVYDILQPVAWDNIRWEEKLEALISDAVYFVFGTLAARSGESRNTLFRLLEIARYKVLDANLRPPHYDRRIVENLLKGLYLLKINLAELELITGWYGARKRDGDRIQYLQDRFHIPYIVVTRGANGALFHAEGISFEHPGYSVTVADTIGSGDASLAGLIAQLLQGKSPPEALAFSGALGALVAARHGACPSYDPAEIETFIHHQQ